MEKIFIIDAVNYLFRSYYAIGPMTNKKGRSTSAVYGFIRSVKKLISDFNPKYIVAVFDGPDSKEARKALYSEYKMNRKAAPDDLYPQFEIAFEFCKIARIPALCIPKFEADDAMATIAHWANKKNMTSYICTSDKDLMQMINEKTFVLNTYKNNKIFDETAVKESFGIIPKQMLDYLAITGDKSDNIPGIEGFGPKTATSLLNEFQSLDNIFNNLDQLSSKKKEVLLKEKEKAYTSKKLASLHLNVEIPTEKDFYLLKSPDKSALKDFYKEMNFLSLLKELQLEEEKKICEKEIHKYSLIDTEEKLDDLIKVLSKEKEICLDSETTDLNILEAKLVGIGFCIKANEAYYVPLNAKLSEKVVLSKIKPFLESEDLSFYGHNIKYDYHIFFNYGIAIKNISFDTLLASYLINPQNRRHNLDILALEKFGKTKIPITDLIGQGKKQISMKDVPIEKITQYCCEDVDFTLRLKQVLEKELKEKKLDHILYDIELPLLFVLAKMERQGIFVDKNKLLEMSKEVNHQLNLIEGEIFSEAGKKFNINSPKQLSEVLYVDLALNLPGRKKSAFSTSADVLEKLKGFAPIIDYIIKYRELKKLLSTYIDAIPKQINASTKRVHTTFNQSVTATGRLSSTNPNLQNIPIKSEEGKKIREGFMPQRDNWVYLSSDYSQIELRLLAHFSEDPKLIKAFQNNEDIHAYTASLVYDVPIEDVSKEMRNVAKTVNFGIIYGQSAYGLSEQIDITPKQAQTFINTYFERYDKVAMYLEKCKKNVYKNKIAYTITGRQRPILEIDNKNPMIRAASERLAINTPLQGTAADLIKIAMIEIDKEIKKQDLKGFMILQIHDELLFEIPSNEIDIFKKLVKEKMENVFSLKVPLTVDIETGKNLAQC